MRSLFTYFVTDSVADRQRRKNENLAKEIFGKNRRASAPAGLNKRNNNKPGAAPSLASRIGVIGAGVAKVCLVTELRSLQD